MSTLTVPQVSDETQFEQLVWINTRAMLPFIQRYYYREPSPVLTFHYLFSAATVLAWVVSGWRAGLDLDGWLTSFAWAVLAFFLLLPLHEGLHGLTYRLCGARDVRYGLSLRQMAAYAVAHGFVADRREFAWVAVTPFLVISTLLAALALVVPAYQPIWLAMLVLHTAGTSGDFAFLNYLYLNRHRELYTYDNADTHLSYFYARK